MLLLPFISGILPPSFVHAPPMADTISGARTRSVRCINASTITPFSTAFSAPKPFGPFSRNRSTAEFSPPHPVSVSVSCFVLIPCLSHAGLLVGPKTGTLVKQMYASLMAQLFLGLTVLPIVLHGESSHHWLNPYPRNRG